MENGQQHALNKLDPYKPAIEIINSSITSFNTFLSAPYAVAILKFDTMIQEKRWVEITHGNWDAFGFPTSEKRGVYFIFGHEKNMPEKNGLYIGKASFGSSIGKRLWRRLNRCRSESHFTMDGDNNERYILDYMASVDLDACGLLFMASALEEYLISELRNKINLINRIGNRHRQ